MGNMMGQRYKKLNAEEGDTNPKQRAGLISHITFGWLSDFLSAGHDHQLSDEDLFSPSEDDNSSEVTRSLEKNWNMNQESKPRRDSRRLVQCLARTVTLSEYFVISLLVTLDAISRGALPLFLIGLVGELMRAPQRSSWVYLYGALLTLSAAVITVSKGQLDFSASLIAMRVRVALLGLLYKKVLQLSLCDQAEMTSGHVINLISNDVQRFDEAIRFLPNICVAPFALLAVCGVSVYLIGWQALVGFAVTVVLIIYQRKVAELVARLRKTAAELADQRLRLLKEIIVGIRAVKMYAWEEHFRTTVGSVRGLEVTTIRSIAAFLASLLTLYIGYRCLSTIAVFLVLLVTGSTLTPYNVFLVYSYNTVTAEYASFYLAFGIKKAMECLMSAERIQQFLETVDATLEQREGFCKKQLLFSAPDCEANGWSPSSTGTNDHDAPFFVSLRIGPDDDKPRIGLNKIDFHCHDNKMVVINGPVGCGKSSLLLTILGELPTTTTQLERNGRVAFVPDVPWVFSGTLRDNILFNSPYDPEKYSKVVDVCALVKDITAFPKGDLTMLGERGVVLSGGQRARVGLARAVYADADIYLLDDPLSAVDPEVGRQIFEKCICHYLSNRCRILVTHQPVYLRSADRIVSMRAGCTEWEGSYHEMLQRLDAPKDAADDDQAIQTRDDQFLRSQVRGKPSSKEEDASKSLDVLQEERQFGSVSLKTYWRYMKAGSPVAALLPMLAFLVFCQAFRAVPDWWIAGWHHVTWSGAKDRHSFYIYAALVMALVLLSYASSMLFSQSIIRSSKNLHDSMLGSVLRAPLLFFDTNPAGRILNRFSKDMGFLDEALLEEILLAVQLFFFLATSILIPALANYWNLIVVMPLVIGSVYYGRYCIRVSREVARLEAVNRSHVYSHFALTLEGLSTIRAHGRQNEFVEEFYRHQDKLTNTWFLNWAIVGWLFFRMNAMVTVFVTAVTFTALLTSQDAGFTALAVVCAIRLLEMTDIMVRRLMKVENRMTSAERIMKYAELDSEPGYANQRDPPENWPSDGRIEFENLSLVYYPGGSSVLEDLSFRVEPNEKFGISGRTGAGKSSLVAALLRMPEPTGRILIDGSDVQQFNLQSYRSRISVISQDPVLFSGTLRSNLDPTTSFGDSDIWSALEAVHMKAPVRKLDKELCAELTEGGSNFSAGERQLLCLARALLQGNKIIVLDEATANIDVVTDGLIQDTIRTKFQNCTVLTIAHRVSTILDYDRVMVLEQGTIVECDKPGVLLDVQGGRFAELCRLTQ